MDADRPRGVTRFFDDIEDPRIDRTKHHKLEDILMIALVAILGGAEAWTQVELFGKSKRDWFGRFLELPNGIPSHDTFGRVFGLLDPDELGKCFARWVAHLSASLGVKAKTIAIDGKTLRGSADAAGGDPALHLLTAWAHEAGLVLAQLAVDAKSNEITAIPELIATLELKGCVVTVDALNTQTDVAEAILARGGDYVMTLKQNQRTLHDDAVFTLAEAEEEPERFTLDEHATDDDAHGRIEHRRYTTLTLDTNAWRITRDRWPGLKAIGRVVRHRTDKATGQTTPTTVYYLMSTAMTAQRFAAVVRGHWGIEASHWVLDVTFNEDRCRSRKDHSDQNFALMRRLAMNLLRVNRDRTKLSMNAQRLKIGWDIDFLDDLLRHLD
jgi:predicted transposase YbfD/YdcC